MSQSQQPDADSESTLEPGDDFFSRSGPLPTTADDVRRYPRFYYRARIEAVIFPFSTAQVAEPTKCCLLARDLSRGGINLLHSEQLFPGQRIDVTLSNAAPRSVEVVWCRRLANRCFSLGCRFTKTDSDAAPLADVAAPAADFPSPATGQATMPPSQSAS
jgi:PilZ domain-containing protein